MTPTEDQVQAMEALVRDLATCSGWGSHFGDRARAIVATLPKPVDADLLAGRKYHADRAAAVDDASSVAEWLRGDYDGSVRMLAFRAGWAAHARKGEG